MKRILKFISLIIVLLISTSCAYQADNDHFIVTRETSYGSGNCLIYVYNIQSVNEFGTVRYYSVRAEADEFEVGDTVKFVKVRR